jgi:hypothetical protein
MILGSFKEDLDEFDGSVSANTPSPSPEVNVGTQGLGSYGAGGPDMNINAGPRPPTLGTSASQDQVALPDATRKSTSRSDSTITPGGKKKGRLSKFSLSSGRP